MVDLRLVDYIKRHVDRGYSKEEITDILKKNKWTKSEISEAYKYYDSKRNDLQKTVSKPAQLAEDSTSPTRRQQLATLKQFIARSRTRGINDQQIKTALKAKKWPDDLLEEAFSILPSVEMPAQKPQPKPQAVKQPREPFNFKLLIWYIIAFIVATAIISGTVFVYYYVVGLSNYTVSVNGEEQHGKCLELDCSDMKESAFDYATNNLVLMLIIGGVASLLIVTLYAFLPIRNTILWIVNILYFLFLVFIGVRWILFNRTI